MQNFNVYVVKWLSLLFCGVVLVFVKVCNRINKHEKAVSKKCILVDFVFLLAPAFAS